MSTYEIEIKSLLGSEEKANTLKNNLLLSKRNFKLSSKHKQLNHYFNTPTNLHIVEKAVGQLIPNEKKDAFNKIIMNGKNVSIRTRDASGQIIFVIKASIGDDTSANGISRIEFEAEMPSKNIEELDNLLIGAGLSYQAKWSREREEYKSKDIIVCLDKNAGYGYLAEFEKVIMNPKEENEAKSEIKKLMKEFGLVELSQERLARMFAYYNQNWQDYYGTDKVFNIE